MIGPLRRLLEEVIARPEPGPGDHDLQLACAVLMVEILRADHVKKDSEWEAVHQHLRLAFKLDDEESAALLELAENRAENIISLHEIIRTINENYGQEERQQLLAMLWEIAYADGRLDKHEEYAIRKIADLLYVPHSAFIRTRHGAEEKNSG